MEHSIHRSEVITPSFGIKLSLIIVAVASFCILGASFIVFTLFKYNQLGPDYKGAFNILLILKKELFIRTLFIYGASGLFTLLGVIVIALLYSHRIAGPMYRLGRFFEEATAKGLRTELKFRKKDATHPLARVINNLMARYDKDLTELANTLHEMEITLSALKEDTITYEEARRDLETGVRKIHAITQGLRI